MDQFVIHLPLTSYVNNDFGKFCIQLGDYYFPSREWTDFGERVVFSWADQLCKLSLEANKRVICRFMDGNYRLDVELTKSRNYLEVSFIKDAGNLDKIERQENVNSEQFFEEILRAMKSIQDECKKDNNHEAVERIEIVIQNFLAAKENYFNQFSKVKA